jgi:hypothetical protein
MIPVRGKHLDELDKVSGISMPKAALCLEVPEQFSWFLVTQKDYMFIGFNKLATAPFVYFFLRYSYFEPNVVWDLDHITLVRHSTPCGIVAS